MIFLSTNSEIKSEFFIEINDRSMVQKRRVHSGLDSRWKSHR